MKQVACLIALVLSVAACTASRTRATPPTRTSINSTTTTNPVCRDCGAAQRALPGLSAKTCLTGVSGSAAARPPGISGTLRMVGGPYPGMDRPVAGAITVRSATSECDLDVGAHGSFELTLPVGTYTVTGRSPSFGGSRYECSGGTVKVTGAGETPVTVVCAVP